MPPRPAPIDPYVAMPWRGPIKSTTPPAAAPAAAAQPAPAPRARINPADVNLGYYTGPASGNARTAQVMRYTDPNDPRIYRGPLSMAGT
jgi:hypothetical protein